MRLGGEKAMRLRKAGRTSVARVVRILAVGAVVAGASAVTVIAAAFGDGAASTTSGPGFTILTQHPTPTARQPIGGLMAPEGAVLASAPGPYAVYVWQRTSEEVCVMALETAGAGGAACARNAEAEAEGLILTLRPSAVKIPGSSVITAVLLPNGVRAVEFTDSSGAVHRTAVESNVASFADAGISRVNYTLPNGMHYGQAIPAGPTAAER
jgi:hypothetical protein